MAVLNPKYSTAPFMTTPKKTTKKRRRTIKRILVSQPPPADVALSPFRQLEKYNVTIEYRSFIEIRAINTREYYRQKTPIDQYTAVIFTSRKAIDHFFDMMNRIRYEMRPDIRYFCTSEQVAIYLQKFITYRRRKIFYPESETRDFFKILRKYKKEKFFFPVPSTYAGAQKIIEFLEKHQVDYSAPVFYHIEAADLSDLDINRFDIIAFFSPFGVQSLFKNFPDYEPGHTKIAVFGENTLKAAEEKGLEVHIQAPTAEHRSLVGAIEAYLKKHKRVR